MDKGKTLVATITSYADRFSLGGHVEGNTLVIDQCEGISLEDGLGAFAPWTFVALLGPPK